MALLKAEVDFSPPACAPAAAANEFAFDGARLCTAPFDHLADTLTLALHRVLAITQRFLLACDLAEIRLDALSVMSANLFDLFFDPGILF